MSWFIYKIYIHQRTSKFVVSFTLKYSLPGEDMSTEFKLCYDGYCGREKVIGIILLILRCAQFGCK